MLLYETRSHMLISHTQGPSNVVAASSRCQMAHLQRSEYEINISSSMTALLIKTVEAAQSHER